MQLLEYSPSRTCRMNSFSSSANKIIQYSSDNVGKQCYLQKEFESSQGILRSGQCNSGSKTPFLCPFDNRACCFGVNTMSPWYFPLLSHKWETRLLYASATILAFLSKIQHFQTPHLKLPCFLWSTGVAIAKYSKLPKYANSANIMLNIFNCRKFRWVYIGVCNKW